MNAKEYIEKRIVIDDNNCWTWQLMVDKDGYGRARFKGKDYRVNRLVYEIYIGEIPKNHFVKTNCGNKFCVNPRHLRLKSQFHHVSFNDLTELQAYIISKIKKDYKGCWIWQGCTHTFGYGRASVCGKSFDAHRLAWIAFNGDIPEKLVVCHGDMCKPSCCNPEHLKLGTQKENIEDRERMRISKGLRHDRAKLCDKDILDILKFRKGGNSVAKIAKMFNVSNSTIDRIIYGKGWKHVKRD